MLTGYLETLLLGKDLSEKECEAVIQEMARGGDSYQMAAFLALMRAKGETAEELTGIVHAMRDLMIPIDLGDSLLDIVGTGGDHSHSVNISTGSAILSAAMGMKIAKHGNRASSSKCGSADVLEYFGINLNMTDRCFEKLGITFLFAQEFHPAMGKIAPIRKALKIRTFFNLIGPLLNPASPEYYLIGVFDAELLELFAHILCALKVKRALVFHGNGLDELTPVGPCQALEINGGKITSYVLTPEELGLKPCTLADLKGGDVALNAKLLKEALGGKESGIFETLAMNGGAAAYITGMAPSIREGIVMAKKTLKEGAAHALLEKWASYAG